MGRAQKASADHDSHNSRAAMATRNPVVSVGMPAFNGEPHIRTAIEAILGQTLRDFELIISDNASTDGTEAICREYASEDPRIRYSRNKMNLGVSENYNRVYRLARGPLFKWASVNDFCHELMLEKCVDALRERPDAVLSYADTMLLEEGESRRPYHEQVRLDTPDPCERFRRLARAFDECFMLNNMMNGVIRTDALRKTSLHGHFPGSDIPLMAELVVQGSFVSVPEVLFFRRIDSQAHSVSKSREEIARYFKPGKDSGFSFLQWRRLGGYARAVRKARPGPRKKVRLYLELLRAAARNRRRLGRELLRPIFPSRT